MSNAQRVFTQTMVQDVPSQSTNISCHFSVAYKVVRKSAGGARGCLFDGAQERAIVTMVVSNNAIQLQEIREGLLQTIKCFSKTHTVSTIHTRPFTIWIKELGQHYVQLCLSVLQVIFMCAA